MSEFWTCLYSKNFADDRLEIAQVVKFDLSTGLTHYHTMLHFDAQKIYRALQKTL